jgi:hypothetical protein
MNTKKLQAEVIKAVGDNRIRFRLTALRIDRHKEVVMPMGIVLEEFALNPVVLYGHGWDLMQGDIPIGKVDMDSFEITKDYVDADVIFDVTNDPFAKMIHGKVKDKFLNSGSIGFIPIEISKEPVLDGQTGDTYTKWKLMEFSIVPFPSNIEAVAQNEYQDYRNQVMKMKGFDPEIVRLQRKDSDTLFNIKESQALILEKIESLKEEIQSLKALVHIDEHDESDDSSTDENEIEDKEWLSEEIAEAIKELDKALKNLIGD